MIPPKKNSFNSLIKFLQKSQYPHLSEISNYLLKKSLLLIDPTNLTQLSSDPFLLTSAVQNPTLCFEVFPKFFETIPTLPSNILTDFDFPLSLEKVKQIIKIILPNCNHENQIQIAEKLLRKISERNKILLDHFEEIILNDNTGIGIVFEVMKGNSELSIEILKKSIDLSQKAPSQKALKILRETIELGSEIAPVDLIVDAVYSNINQNYSPTTSGKKKCEIALKWALKLTKKFQTIFQEKNLFP